MVSCVPREKILFCLTFQTVINIKSVCSTPPTPSHSASPTTPSQGHTNTTPTSYLTATPKASADRYSGGVGRDMEESHCVRRAGRVILDAATVHFHCARCTPHRQERNVAASADPT